LLIPTCIEKQCTRPLSGSAVVHNWDGALMERSIYGYCF